MSRGCPVTVSGPEMKTYASAMLLDALWTSIPG